LQIWYLLACANTWTYTGDVNSLAYADQAEQRIAETGILAYSMHVHWHRTLVSIVRGDVVLAETERAILMTILKDMRGAQPLLNALVNYSDALRQAQCGRLPLALERMQQAVALTDLTISATMQRYLRVLHGWLHVLHGDEAAAEARFAELRESDGSCADPFAAPILAMAEADRAYRFGREAEGDFWLRKALSLGRPGDLACWCIMGPVVISPLYQRALRLGIEPEFVRAVIRRTGITPPDPADPCWPWPVKIKTLGRFAIELDGEELAFQRKTQQKPLDLLKALIALGGQEVLETTLMECLWPDSEGDAALSNLRTTLHRLRGLLKHESALTVEGGRLSLNRSCVWVDSLALLGSLRQLDSLPIETMRCLVDNYGGPFLKGENASWCLIPRDQIQAQFLRLIERVGERLETANETEAAIDCYLMAVDSEPLAELCYRRLILLYARLDRRAEALTVYRRCHHALMSELGCPPSQTLQKLIHELQSVASDDMP
jgi:DNA-binding SARP family transcriptional activator